MNPYEIYACNMPYEASEDDIHEWFAQIGPVKHIKLFTKEGRFIGSGLVKYETIDAAQAALELLNGETWQGRVLKVVPSRRAEHHRIRMVGIPPHFTEQDIESLISPLEGVLNAEWVKDHLELSMSSGDTFRQAFEVLDRVQIEDHELQLYVHKRAKLMRLSQEGSALLDRLCTTLQETEVLVQKQIGRVIRYGGESFAEVVLEETLAIEEQGGMMTMDQSRRRTPGGVFFTLVRDKLPKRLHRHVFSQNQAQAKQKSSQKPPPSETVTKEREESLEGVDQTYQKLLEERTQLQQDLQSGVGSQFSLSKRLFEVEQQLKSLRSNYPDLVS